MVTISDVAREAGVSNATVSRVLNRKKTKIPISDNTIKKVLAAAERLNYAPNRAAQNLRTGSTNSIGFLLCERPFSNQHYYVMLKCLESELAKRGKNLLFSIYNPKEELPQMIKERAVDGLFLAGRVTKEVVDKIQISNVPFIVLGSMTDKACNINILSIDMVDSITKIYDYLLTNGHKDILYFSDYKEPLVIEKILIGCEKAYKKHNLPSRTDLIKTDFKDPYFTIDTVLAEHPEVTALIMQQHYTNAMMRILESQNLSIPDQISVIIFGDESLDEWQRGYFTHWSSATDKLVECGVDNMLKLCKNREIKVDKLIKGDICEGVTVKKLRRI